MIELDSEDSYAIAKIFQEKNFTYFSSKFRYLGDYLKNNNNTTPLIKNDTFFDKIVLENSFFQDKFMNYFLENKGENLAEDYYEKIKSNRWNSYPFFSYLRFIKNGSYYPKQENEFISLIKSQISPNQKTFFAMISFSKHCKNDFISAECFSETLKKKKDTLIPLLDLEKIKKHWDQRFDNIDIESIAPNEFNYMNSLFNRISNSNSQDFSRWEDNYQISLTLDIDLLSQFNKLSPTKHIESLRIFFNKFNTHLKERHEPKELLSINSFSIKEGMQFSLSITYNDINKKAAIQKVFSDLVDFAISKDTNKERLKGFSLPENNNLNDFFKSFILDSHLNHTLIKEKIDTIKIKKPKI